MVRHSRKIPPNQPVLLEAESRPEIKNINIASIPHRSVFRYPGGKTWFVPYLRQWLKAMPTPPNRLIEPFAGGGIIGLTAVFEHLVEAVTLVELDPQIASVWHTILSNDATWLVERIQSFELTAKNVAIVLEQTPSSTRDLAFQTILKNRVNHGGILAKGVGQIKAGENGKGLTSRWYPQTLGRRILNIVAIKERIQFIEGDGLGLMQDKAACASAAFFIDPPYTAGGKRAGSRLYTYSDLNHQALFATAEQLAGDFLMTYDNAEDVRSLAQAYGFCVKNIAMKNTHHAQMTELLVSRRLDWLVTAST
jgi:DNA adenine methylase